MQIKVIFNACASILRGLERSVANGRWRSPREYHLSKCYRSRSGSIVLRSPCVSSNRRHTYQIVVRSYSSPMCKIKSFINRSHLRFLLLKRVCPCNRALPDYKCFNKTIRIRSPESPIIGTFPQSAKMICFA